MAQFAAGRRREAGPCVRGRPPLTGSVAQAGPGLSRLSFPPTWTKSLVSPGAGGVGAAARAARAGSSRARGLPAPAAKLAAWRRRGARRRHRPGSGRSPALGPPPRAPARCVAPEGVARGDVAGRPLRAGAKPRRPPRPGLRRAPGSLLVGRPPFPGAPVAAGRRVRRPSPLILQQQQQQKSGKTRGTGHPPSVRSEPRTLGRDCGARPNQARGAGGGTEPLSGCWAPDRGEATPPAGVCDCFAGTAPPPFQDPAAFSQPLSRPVLPLLTI